VQAWGSSLASLGLSILNGSNGTFSSTPKNKRQSTGRAGDHPWFGSGTVQSRYYSVVQKGWPLMHDEPSALSNQLFGRQLLKAEDSLPGKVHPFRARL
jgi:hypothetical protein